MSALPGELHLVVKVFDALTSIIDKHNHQHQQESGALVSMCVTDALLDRLMDLVKTELVPILSQRRGSLWPYLAALESLTSLFCSHFLKGVLQTIREDLDRCSLASNFAWSAVSCMLHIQVCVLLSRYAY